MYLCGVELRTPEDVRDFLGSPGMSLPPSDDGPVDAIRNDADDAEVAIAGMILAVEGPPRGRSEGIHGLRCVGGSRVDASVSTVLPGPVPGWRAELDPLRGGAFGEGFISTCLIGEAPVRYPQAVLDRSVGTSDADEARFSVFWSDSNGPAAEQRLSLLPAGCGWTPQRWRSSACSVQRGSRCAALMAALRGNHDSTV